MVREFPVEAFPIQYLWIQWPCSSMEGISMIIQMRQVTYQCHCHIFIFHLFSSCGIHAHSSSDRSSSSVKSTSLWWYRCWLCIVIEKDKSWFCAFGLLSRLHPFTHILLVIQEPFAAFLLVYFWCSIFSPGIVECVELMLLRRFSEFRGDLAIQRNHM